MDPHFKPVLFIGWLSGCFPVKTPQNLKPRVHKATLVYSLIVFAIYIFFDLSIFASEELWLSKMSPSKVIMTYLMHLNTVLTFGGLRLWSLVRFPQFINYIQEILLLKKDIPKCSKDFHLKFRIGAYVIVLIDFIQACYSIYDFISTLNGPTQKYINLIFFQLPFPLAFTILQFFIVIIRYFMLGVTFCLGIDLLQIFDNFCEELSNLYCHHVLSEINIVESTESPENRKKITKENVVFKEKLRKPWTVKIRDGREVIFKQVRPGGDRVSGTKLTDIPMWTVSFYNAMKYPLKVQTLSEKFTLIQRAFDDFNRVEGLSIFIMISHSTLSIIQKLYGFVSLEYSILSTSNPDPLRFISKTLISIATVTVMAHFGECISRRIKEWKEQLKCIMLMELLCEKSHDLTNTLTNSVIKWQWDLHPLKLFKVNHALLPAIAGTIVTYVIVVVQLRFSETKNQVNSFNKT